MGQAKKRKEEIAKLKAQGPKLKASIDGFRPDAGLNSQEGTNYYWFQVAELIQSTAGVGARAYNYEGKRWLEFNTPVDIMDEAGEEQKAPYSADGYFATFRMTAEMLDNFSEQIAKGAMSVRVTGVPSETATAPNGEKFRVIEVTDVWSQGNNGGFMSYFVVKGTGMIKTNSQELSAHYRQISKEMVEEA